MENTTEAVESPQENMSVEDASTNDLRSLLNNQAPTEAQPMVEQSLETEPQGDVTPEVADPNLESTVNVDDSESERLAKRRIRPKSDLDQQVIDLYRSEGFQGSFQDASNVIYGNPEPAQIQQAPAEPPRNPQQETEDKISGIRTEIETLNTQVKEAADALDTVTALELQNQVMEKRLEIQKLETLNQVNQDRLRFEAENTRRHRSAESRDQAINEYPQLGDENSIYRKEFDSFISRASNDPDYAPLFQSPKWPEMLAREFGMMKGVSPTSQAPVAQQAVQPPAQHVGNQAKVLTTGATAQPVNAPAPTNDIGGLTNEQLYSLLGTSNGQRDPLR
ncbi:MAG: hypothetical protein ACO3MJ_10630 [Alphaproteobacteria bacterium]